MPETDEGWQVEWELYALSVIRLTRAAIPYMQERGRGSIVNMSSCGVHQIVPRFAPSEVPRLAMTGFAKYLATKLAPDHIRVNNVLPGYINNERSTHEVMEEAQERGTSPEDVLAEWSAGIPMGHWGEEEDVADLIAFLASERAKYITGTNIRVDGGWCLAPTF
jgi:3-oxoacyl-[acyl-carrier protein] reductase